MVLLPFLPKAEQTWVSSLSVRDIPSYQGHQVGPNLGQHDFQAHFYKEISTWGEKNRLATGNVLAMLLAAHTLKLDSRSSEGHPQHLKLTPLSNTWCYNLIQENNYQKYPSNTKKKKSVQPTTAWDTSSELHSEANPFDLMPCFPFLSPCSVLQPLYYQQSIMVHANGIVYTVITWWDAVYLV